MRVVSVCKPCADLIKSVLSVSALDDTLNTTNGVVIEAIRAALAAHALKP